MRTPPRRGRAAAHIAMMEEEVVRERGWLTPEETPATSAVLLWLRVNSAWLVLGGAAGGLLRAAWLAS